MSSSGVIGEEFGDIKKKGEVCLPEDEGLGVKRDKKKRKRKEKKFDPPTHVAGDRLS